MSATVHSLLHTGPYSAQAVSEAAARIREAQGATSHAAFVFCTGDYLPHFEEFSDILRVDGRITDLCGCTGSGIVGGNVENEEDPSFSIMAISDAATEFVFVPLTEDSELVPEQARAVHSWISLLNPYTLAADAWLLDWNSRNPAAALVGGLASSRSEAQSTAVFYNGKILEGGLMIGFAGDSLRILPVMSQGCRPIGEPLTVTRAENNVLFALGSQPAYEALESAFQTLSDDEKSTARGNLFAGLAGTEYVEDFRPGDFLIRNILGADPASGAVVIGGVPRVGQTLQYQFRDRAAATDDLQSVLTSARKRVPRPLGALAFTCAARGRQFFGKQNHDIEHMIEAFGRVPHAGFFCNGEIGPVHSVNCLTSYTAAIGLLYHEK